jgi:hypothetical protein
MTGLFGQSEKANSILFIAFLSLYLFSLFGMVSDVWFYRTETLFLIMLLTGSIFYGFISKSPIKSFILGFLIWFLPIAIIGIYDIIESSEPVQLSDFLGLVFWMVFCLLNGGVGYFIAATNSDKRKQLLYRIFSLMILFLLAMFFIAGIN